jgi:hypothetical protein
MKGLTPGNFLFLDIDRRLAQCASAEHGSSDQSQLGLQFGPGALRYGLVSGATGGIVRNPKRKVSRKGGPAIYKYNYSWYYTPLKVDTCYRYINSYPVIP